MAIYTQYARYLKAKEFKNMIEDYGDTYMLLGLGNPFWDNMTDDTVSSQNAMPVAPFNTSIMTENGITGSGITQNQFLDTGACQYFSQDSDNTDNPTLLNGVPQDGTYINAVKNLLPPFPCVWDSNNIIFEYTGGSITVGELHSYYISTMNGGASVESPSLMRFNSTSHVWEVAATGVTLPSGSDSNKYSIYRQAYAEMYVRGLAIDKGYKQPVGLLGAVRCNVNFVKDIGSDNTIYKGLANQFWYGDRYWEIVESIDDNPINEYIKVNDSDTGEETIFPHHLLFNATINPRQLNGSLDIDQNIVPRHIAIFVKKRESGEQKGPAYYKVGDVAFNLGQYTINDSTPTDILNFTLPVKVSKLIEDSEQVDEYTNGDFKFILNDYIKGSVRDKHSIDRIGYVLGF